MQGTGWGGSPVPPASGFSGHIWGIEKEAAYRLIPSRNASIHQHYIESLALADGLFRPPITRKSRTLVIFGRPGRDPWFSAAHIPLYANWAENGRPRQHFFFG